jgi:hypothetical protein
MVGRLRGLSNRAGPQPVATAHNIPGLQPGRIPSTPSGWLPHATFPNDGGDGEREWRRKTVRPSD